MSMLKYVPILCAIFSGTLYGFTPGRWSPLDNYSLHGSPGGPVELQVETGKVVVEIISFNYDGMGRLTKEVYKNPASGNKGYREYQYKNNRLSSELLYDSNNKLIEKKEFSYDGNGMSQFIVYDGENREMFKQKLYSKKSLVISGEEYTNGNVDKFKMEYADSKLLFVKFFESNGKEFARVSYHYDNKGRLLYRIRTQGESISKCDYAYGTDGKIISFIYADQIDGKWVETKILRLKY